MYKRLSERPEFRFKVYFLILVTFLAPGSGTGSVLDPGLWIRIRIGSVFNWVCGSGSVFGIRIRIQKGKKAPQK